MANDLCILKPTVLAAIKQYERGVQNPLGTIFSFETICLGPLISISGLISGLIASKDHDRKHSNDLLCFFE